MTRYFLVWFDFLLRGLNSELIECVYTLCWTVFFTAHQDRMTVMFLHVETILLEQNGTTTIVSLLFIVHMKSR